MGKAITEIKIIMRPLISVIIPVYNHAKTIERSLISLAKQTYRPLEVIIVNDGSTDNFLEVMEEIKNRHPIDSLNGKVISQTNQGAGAARNRGFKESTGEFVIFWDADTVAHPGMLEKMITVLLVHDEASYVYSRYRFGWKLMKSQEFNLADLRKYNYIDTTSLIRRRDFCGFDKDLKRFQDWDLWLTMSEKGKTGIFLPESLFKKIVSGRVGYSSWQPSLVYKLPWKNKKTRDFDTAVSVIYTKHNLVH